MKRMVSALVTASREANNLLREVSYCSHNPRFDTERDIPDEETNDWRAVCGKTASTVRREGRRKPSQAAGGRERPRRNKAALQAFFQDYPYQGPQHAAPGLLRRKGSSQ